MMHRKQVISRLQILIGAAGLAAVAATVVAILPNPASDDDAYPVVTRSDPSDALAPTFAAPSEPLTARQQVYALDRPASGVLVTLGRIHLQAGNIEGEPKPLLAAEQSDDALIDAALEAGQLTRARIQD